jgi:M6 family metalloprotease-like protein
MLKKLSALITVLLVSIAFSTNVFADTTYEMNKKLLVILVEFTETTGTPEYPGSLDAYPDNVNSDGTLKYDGTIKNDDSYYSNLYFGTSGETVRNYYREVSNGKLDYSPVEETSGTSNDGIVRVKLPIPHPNQYSSEGTLSYIALNSILDNLFDAGVPSDLLDSSIDFSSLDTNGDNTVTLNGINNDELNIAMVFASRSMNGPGTREFVQYSGDFNYDNKHMQGEIAFLNSYSSIFTICHEIAHLREAIDLYNIEGTNIGNLSLMNTGFSHLDPYHKIKLGFVSPILVNSSGTYMVNSTDPNEPSSYNVLKIPIRADNDKVEYFLVENRRAVGFDSLILDSSPSGGIAVWHIEELSYGGLSKIRLEIANEKQVFPNGLAVYDRLYYNDGYGGKSVFGPATSPSNSKSFSGRDGMVTISVNGPSSSSMSVTVNMLTTPPQNFKISSEGLNTKLIWDSVDGASEYEVSVDKGGFFSVGSGTSYLLPYGHPNTNKHSYIIRAKDIYGDTIESSEIDTMGILFGDVDRNGEVNFSDISMLNDYIVGSRSFLTDTQMLAADVDGNGIIDDQDVQTIISYVGKTITQFPVGQLKVITYGDVNGDGAVTQSDYDIVYNNPDGPNGERNIVDLAQRIAANVGVSNYDGTNKIELFDALCIRDYINGSRPTFPAITDPNSK